MEKTTSCEFVEWMIVLNEEVNGFHREDHYLAQIAAEIRRTILKDPTKVSASDMLLTFQTKEDSEKDSWGSKSEEEIAEECEARSKAHWFAVLGIREQCLASI